MKQRSNDKERELWVNNDEGLYLDARRWMRCNKGGMRGYLRANRTMIDACIHTVLEHKPASPHY